MSPDGPEPSPTLDVPRWLVDAFVHAARAGSDQGRAVAYAAPGTREPRTLAPAADWSTGTAPRDVLDLTLRDQGLEPLWLIEVMPNDRSPLDERRRRAALSRLQGSSTPILLQIDPRAPGVVVAWDLREPAGAIAVNIVEGSYPAPELPADPATPALDGAADALALLALALEISSGLEAGVRSLAAVREPGPVASLTGALVDERGRLAAARERAAAELAAESERASAERTARGRTEQFTARLRDAEALPAALLERAGRKAGLPDLTPAATDEPADKVLARLEGARNLLIADFEGDQQRGQVRRTTSLRLVAGLGVGGIAILAAVIAASGSGLPASTLAPGAARSGASAAVALGSVATRIPTPFVPTPTPAPTPTPTPAPTPVQVTAAAKVTIGLPYSGKGGLGAIDVSLVSPRGVVSGTSFDVRTTRIDALGNQVAGDRVAANSTDKAGIAHMEVPAGTYVVLGDLAGYNWGNLSSDDGLIGIVVAPGMTTRVDLSYGSLTFSAASVDKALAGQTVYVETQKTSATGGIVLGARVCGFSTDNTGTASCLVTPGAYAVASRLNGYNWGDLSDTDGTTNVQVIPGKDTLVAVRLGRITVSASPGASIRIYYRTAAGAAGEYVDGRSTDNAGYASFDLTAGTYNVTINNKAAGTATVESGATVSVP